MGALEFPETELPKLDCNLMQSDENDGETIGDMQRNDRCDIIGLLDQLCILTGGYLLRRPYFLLSVKF